MAIKAVMPKALREIPHLLIARDQNDIIAFMGIDKNRLEMLFLHPSCRGCGTGKQLLQHAMREYGICEVSVNEANAQAAGFYKHMGFCAVSRSALDEQGRPYPIIHMHRAQ